MNFSNRALISLVRNRKKTFTLGLIIFLLSILMSGAVLIQQASRALETNLRNRQPPIITLERSPEWLMDYYHSGLTNKLPPFPLDIIPKLMTLAYVEDIVVSSQNVGGIMALSRYVPIKDINESRAELIPHFVGEDFNSFITFGIDRPEPPLIQSGMAKLVDGRLFTEEEISNHRLQEPIPTIIFKGLAGINNLNVGSLIHKSHFVNLFEGWTREEEELLSSLEIELEIIGLFDVDFEMFNHVPSGTTLDFRLFEELNWALNHIYVPLWFNIEYSRLVEEKLLNVWDEERVSIHTNFPQNPIIILDSPLNVNSFMDEANPLLSNEFEFVHSEMNIIFQLTALNNLEQLMDWIVIGTVGALICILSLLIILGLIDRKDEMGIYLALGEKKFKIILQLVIEILSIFLLATTMSLFIGHLISNTLSERLLHNELTNLAYHEESRRIVIESQGTAFISGAILERIPMDAFENMFTISLTPGIIAIFYGIGIATVIFSTLLPIIYILKINPKKILMSGKIG